MASEVSVDVTRTLAPIPLIRRDYEKSLVYTGLHLCLSSLRYMRCSCVLFNLYEARQL